MQVKYPLFTIGFVSIAISLVEADVLKSNLFEFEVKANTASTVSAKSAVKFTHAYLLPEKVGDSYSHVVAELYYIDEKYIKHIVAILDSHFQNDKEINVFLPPEIPMKFSVSGPKSVQLVGYELPLDEYKSIPMNERYPYYATNEALELFAFNKRRALSRYF